MKDRVASSERLFTRHIKGKGVVRRVALRGLALAAAVALSCGCPPPGPRTPPGGGPAGSCKGLAGAVPQDLNGLVAYAKKRMGRRDDIHCQKEAVTALEKAGKKAGAGVDVLSDLVRSACRVAELAGKDAVISRYAGVVMAAARKGMAAHGQRVEFPYFFAAALGLKLQADASAGAISQLPKVVKAARKAIQLNEKFEMGGPLRLLGAVYVNAPQSGSIGDPEKGVKLLTKAVSLFPNYPLNRFLLAEGLVKEEDFEKAEAEFRKVLKAPLKGRWSGRDAQHYRKRARAYIKRLQRRKGGGPGI